MWVNAKPGWSSVSEHPKVKLHLYAAETTFGSADMPWPVTRAAVSAVYTRLVRHALGAVSNPQFFQPTTAWTVG
jgi:hypothetical protein